MPLTLSQFWVIGDYQRPLWPHVMWKLRSDCWLLRNWQFDFTTDQVSPPGVGGMIQFCTQQLSRSCRRKFEHFRQIAQSYILLLASLLQYSTPLPWQIQRTLLWSLSHWTVYLEYIWIHGHRNANDLWRFFSMHSFHTDSHGLGGRRLPLIIWISLCAAHDT